MEIFRLFGTILIDNRTANESIHRTGDLAEKTGEKFLGAAGKAQKAGGSFTDFANKAGNMALKVQAAIVAVQTTIFAFAQSTASTADRVDKLSQKLGMSRQAFQEWDYVLAQNGASIEQLQVGMKTMTKRMEEAAKGAGVGAEGFKKLGVVATDTKGKLKSQEQMFEELVKALTKMPDGIEKSKLAFELFGKAGTELLPMLNGTSDSIEELKKRAHELGLVLGDETVDAGVKLGDTIDDVKKSFEGIKNKIGAEVMPQVQRFLDEILKRLPRITENTVAFAGAVGDLLIGLMDFNDALGGVPAKLLLFTVVSGKAIGAAGRVAEGVVRMHEAYKRFTEFAGASNGIAGLGTLLSNPFTIALGAIMAVVVGLGILADAYTEMERELQKTREQETNEKLSKRIFYKLSPEAQKITAERMKNNEYLKSIGQADYYGYYENQKKKEAFEQKQNKKKIGIDGSFATGLKFVPHDGFIAELHRGERVLTAEEARKGQETSNGGGTVSVVIQAVYMQDITEIDKLVEQIERKINERKRALGRA